MKQIKITDNEFIRFHQKSLGERAIGASTLRSQGASGVIRRARNYLKRMDLKPLKRVRNQKQFRKYLEERTRRLANSFPDGAKGNWGAARKAINIFLRDCSYNRHVSKAFILSKVNKWLEVPLDSHVAEGLAGNSSSPIKKWKSIKSLNLVTSDYYQELALRIAKDKGIARVDLDLIYWRSKNN